MDAYEQALEQTVQEQGRRIAHLEQMTAALQEQVETFKALVAKQDGLIETLKGEDEDQRFDLSRCVPSVN